MPIPQDLERDAALAGRLDKLVKFSESAEWDDVCEWAEENATTFGSNKTSKENWKKMLEEGHVRHEEGNMIFI